MADPIDESIIEEANPETPEERAERLQLTITSSIDSLVVLKELEAYTELDEDQTMFKTSNEDYLIIVKDRFPEMDADIAVVFETPSLFDPEDIMWVPYKRSDTPIIIATVPELPAEEILARKVTELNLKLKAVYDNKLSEIHVFIAEGLISENVLREYEIKERKALEAVTTSDYSFFTEAAVEYGMTAEELVDLILTLAAEWRIKEDVSIMRVGTMRSGIEALISTGDVLNADIKLNELVVVTIETLIA